MWLAFFIFLNDKIGVKYFTVVGVIAFFGQLANTAAGETC